MNQAGLFNLLGTGLIVSAVILHIVCMSMPHYAELDVVDVIKKVVKMGMALNPDSSDSDVDPSGAMSMLSSGDMELGLNYGLWKICSGGKVQHIEMNTCLKWGEDLSKFVSSMGGGGLPPNIDKEMLILETPGWIHGAQAMAVISVLAAIGVGVLSVINILTPSKGDRLRLLPLFILGICVFAGTVMLVGNLIVAVRYKDALDTMKKLPTAEIDKGIDVAKDFFYLSWGFALDIVAVALTYMSGLAHLLGGRATMSQSSVI